MNVQYFKFLYTALCRVSYIVPYVSEHLRVFCVSILIPQLQNEEVAVTPILLMGKVWHAAAMHLTDQENKARGLSPPLVPPAPSHRITEELSVARDLWRLFSSAHLAPAQLASPTRLKKSCQ